MSIDSYVTLAISLFLALSASWFLVLPFFSSNENSEEEKTLRNKTS